MLADFLDDMFKSIFMHENCSILIQISLTFVPTDTIDNKSAMPQLKHIEAETKLLPLYRQHFHMRLFQWKFHWSLFLRLEFTIFQRWLR